MSQRRESGGGQETVSTSYTFALKGTKDANFSLLKKAVEMCINVVGFFSSFGEKAFADFS